MAVPIDPNAYFNMANVWRQRKDTTEIAELVLPNSSNSIM